MNAVGRTALWVAAFRALESERDDALFRDPFARALAGDDGFAVLASARQRDRRDVPSVAVRTRFYDDRIIALRQVVILAAGMDARAYRLAWAAGTRVFELDQPEVLAYKDAILARAGAAPSCARVAVGIDLRDDWPTALITAGFATNAPTVWLVEGLLPYLRAVEVDALLARISALAVPGSVLLFDTLTSARLSSTAPQPMRAFATALGAPWLFGCDDPAALLAAFGWDARAHDFATIGNALGRWPVAVGARPPGAFLVEATRR